MNVQKPSKMGQKYDNEQKQERSRLTREAMVDIDTDLVIDHQLAQAWADSLGTGMSQPTPETR